MSAPSTPAAARTPRRTLKKTPDRAHMLSAFMLHGRILDAARLKVSTRILPFRQLPFFRYSRQNATMYSKMRAWMRPDSNGYTNVIPRYGGPRISAFSSCFRSDDDDDDYDTTVSRPSSSCLLLPSPAPYPTAWQLPARPLLTQAEREARSAALDAGSPFNNKSDWIFLLTTTQRSGLTRIYPTCGDSSPMEPAAALLRSTEARPRSTLRDFPTVCASCCATA